MTKKILAVLFSLIMVLGLTTPAFAYEFVDRNAVVDSDFSISWDNVTGCKYSMCIYAPDSGNPTELNFSDSDIVKSGSRNKIDGSFLKAAVTERAAKDKLSGNVTFELRINEAGDDYGIAYSLFSVDVDNMKVVKGNFTSINNIDIELNLTDADNPVIINTPNVKLNYIQDFKTGSNFENLSKPGEYTLSIEVEADDGYYIPGNCNVNISGKDLIIEDIRPWHNTLCIHIDLTLNEDEVHGTASDGFFASIINAIKAFFASISDFFRNLFGPKV